MYPPSLSGHAEHIIRNHVTGEVQRNVPVNTQKINVERIWLSFTKECVTEGLRKLL